MKKQISLLICTCTTMILIISGCSNQVEIEHDNNESTAPASSISQPSAIPNTQPEISDSKPAIDVDLTQLSSTMVYSEVYNMMVTPDNYIGKTVKMSGQFAVYEDEATGSRYYAVIIADATACCQQGLEFVWNGEHAYPGDYPEIGATIEVIGEFRTYQKNEFTYCYLLSDEVVFH